jgi:hypothetical protein
MLAVVEIFGVIPGTALQMALMRPLFVDRLGEQTDMVLRSSLVFFGAIALNTLGYTMAKLAALDGLEGWRRPVHSLVLAGFGRYVRAVWLLLPISFGGQWLADRFGFLAGLAVVVPFFYFLTDYAVARRSLGHSAATSILLFKRHAFSVIVNDVLLYGASYVLNQGYGYFVRHWRDIFLWQGQAGLAGMVFITLIDLALAAWSMALYGALRDRLETPSARAAAVFE